MSGFGAGFLCAVLSTVAADFFVFAPRFSFIPETSEDLADLLLFGPLAAYLVMAITQMRNAIEREQAKAHKDRLQLALDAPLLGSWRSDPLRRVVSGDARFKEIMNVTTDETPFEEIKRCVHPDDAEKFLADLEASIDPVNPKSYAHEYRFQRSDGEVRWVEIHALAYFEGSGRKRRFVGFVGTVQDITERHLLMREVNHRARNMLSVVDAIAHQTVASSPEEYVGRFSERIWALTVYQDLLVRSEWKGVKIEDLVRAQLAPFADLIGSRIAVCGSTLRLNAASAQAIGLALHELATNAGKYGALSNDTGGLDISWWTDGETFKMSWIEREGPPVFAPKRRGFGTVVTQEMAERSVHGKVDLEYAPSGVTWRLTCPAVNALEPTA
jgi:PAS domain S-box-containing protein